MLFSTVTQKTHQLGSSLGTDIYYEDVFSLRDFNLGFINENGNYRLVSEGAIASFIVRVYFARLISRVIGGLILLSFICMASRAAFGMVRRILALVANYAPRPWPTRLGCY